MTYYYKDILRLDWGFGNPNTTGAFITMLAISCLGVGICWRKSYWFLYPIVITVLTALLHTLSRGAMVGFICGLVVLVSSTRPRLSPSKTISLLLAGVMLLGYGHYIGGVSRYALGIVGVEDRSIENRLLIYREVPAMLLDSPGGWVDGGAEAFHQWYQPEGRCETYRNLVNSHFTWLVEWPIWKRLSYLCGWALIIAFCWPYRQNTWTGIALAVWISFFVVSCFSAVAHRFWIWPLPLGWLIAVLIHRSLVARSLPKPAVVGGAIASGMALYVVILIPAMLGTRLPMVKEGDNCTVVGNAQASKNIALCGSDNRILGDRFGHRLRAFIRERPDHCFTIYKLNAKEAFNYHTLVIVGDELKSMEVPKSVETLFLLNPGFPPSDWNPAVTTKIRVILGDLYSSPAAIAWENMSRSYPNILIERVSGEGIYLESWLNHIE